MRTAQQVEAEITFQWRSFLDCELAGEQDHADRHYAQMDRLLEERGLIPHPRLPSDRDGHTAPRPA